MPTALSTLQTNLGYHLGVTISSISRWSTTQTTELLNEALRKVVADLAAAKCWKLLHEIEEEAEYTLTGATSYDVYTIIGSSTNYQCFIGGRVGRYPLKEATIEEEHRCQNSHEYEPTALTPWIIFFDYDSATGHGSLPVCRIKPSALTETLYFRYLKNAHTMSDTVNSCLPAICDMAVIFLAAAYCWSGDRNGEEFSRFYQLHQAEMSGLIAKYEQPIFYDVHNEPIT